MPAKTTLLAIFDESARDALQKARKDLAPIVERETPKGRTGVLQREMRPRTERTKTGVALVIGARRGRGHGFVTVARVVRWVNRGTGLHRRGPGDKLPITPRRPWRSLVLPGGRKVKSVAGQQPNPFMARIRATGTPRVNRLARAGAAEAARRVEKEIG